MRAVLWSAFILIPCFVLANEDLPSKAASFFESHCYECHAGDEEFIEGDVNLETATFDWSALETSDFWTRVYEVVHTSDMPPRDADSFPSADEREDLLSWIGAELTQHAPIGGTLPRRLNKVEYENTIRTLFDDPEFSVPPSFPSDEYEEGFDNVASGLNLSPPLLAQYLEIATTVVDEVLPEPVKLAEAESQSYRVPPKELATAEGAGAALAENAYRLVSSRNMASAAGWTTLFEAPVSGIYHVRLDARIFQTGNMFYKERESPFRLEVYARQNSEQKYDLFENIRKLGAFDVPASEDQASSHELEAELYLGEVLGFRWADGPIFSDPGRREVSHDFIDDRLLNDRSFYAAAIKLNGGKRGSTQIEFYEAIRDLMEGGKLDLSDPQLENRPEIYGGGLSNGPHNWSKAYAQEEMHRFGPGLDILGVSIEGPYKVIPDQLTRQRLARSKAFLGPRPDGIDDIEFAEQILRRFLPEAFRRPVTDDQLDEYLEVVRTHLEEFPEKRVEEGLHLAIRRALISPRFLFRGFKPGKLDDWDLASRLSYFLTSGPPDDRLLALAELGVLSDKSVLESEVQRLLAKPERNEFVRHFTGQWLSTRKLKDVMPDPRLLRFLPRDRETMIEETERFFEEILIENHPLDTFIDPGFSYRNQFLNAIYESEVSGREMRRIALPKGGKEGGLLGLASIMMATANGVDTHPVHRGVWLLENVLGMPTPSPPPEVPAVAPDTSGTTTMREQMLAHQADPTCARCHKKIDPLGFIMENFDPVGRWREHYPVYTEEAAAPLKEEFYSSDSEATRLGRRIDASATMPDGTVLKDVTDLKAYILDNMDLFAECLTEKLMIYATGRSLTFGDKRVARELAKDLLDSQGGFQDLIIAVVLSDSFFTR